MNPRRVPFEQVVDCRRRGAQQLVVQSSPAQRGRGAGLWIAGLAGLEWAASWREDAGEPITGASEDGAAIDHVEERSRGVGDGVVREDEGREPGLVSGGSSRGPRGEHLPGNEEKDCKAPPA